MIQAKIGKKPLNKDVISRIIMIIGICVFALIFNIVYAYVDHSKIFHEEIKLNDGWNIIIQHPNQEVEIYEDVNLVTTRFNMMNEGDIIVMSRVLPRYFPKHPMLRVYTMHSTIRVLVDRDVIYEYGLDQRASGQLVGYGEHFIILDDFSAEEKLTIMYETNENEAYSTFTPPVIQCGDYSQIDFIMQNRLQIVIVLFIIVFGVLVTVLASFYSLRNKNLRRLIGVGLFSILVGLWFMCNSNIMQVFTYNLQLKTFLEFGTLYAAPTFLFSYFHYESKKTGGIPYTIYKIILAWQILFMVVSWTLQFLNIVHFPAMLKYGQFNICVMVIFLLVRYVVNIVKGSIRNGPLVFGFILLSVFVISDIVRFNIQKYYEKSLDEHYVSLIHIGVLVFVVSMIVDFFISYLEGVYEKAEKDALEKLANTDYLTGLDNRRSIEELMDKLDEEKSEYTVIGFDLNNLKLVNDNLGHEEGDRYIKEFAYALNRVFANHGVSARNGGDEFVTILPQGKKLDKEKLLKSLEEQLDTLNLKNPGWSMSTAYGYCDFDEEGVRNIRDAAKIADIRMYENKIKMKKNAGGR